MNDLSSPSSAPPVGIYLHVPFCSSRCDFCAFYERDPHRPDIEAYLDGVEQEITLFQQLHPEAWRRADTVFWGGGTPGVLRTGDIERLGRIFARGRSHPFDEWTVELAPSTVREERLESLRSIGVTRASVGVQTFSDELLERIGRRQSSAQAMRALDLVAQAQFSDVNIDLMFDLPGQTFESFENDVAIASRFKPHHLSTYCLTFEEDTALWMKLSRGQLTRDAEREADFYSKAWQTLEAHGFQQYEVSNFSLPGHWCRHNVHTWQMSEWIGFGPSASSQFNGIRFTNIPDLQQWLGSIPIRKTARAMHPATVDRVDLDSETLAADALVFGLRKVDGVNFSALRARFPEWRSERLSGLFQMLRKEGYMVRSGTQPVPEPLHHFPKTTDEIISLTRSGLLIADAIGVAILEALDS